MNDNFNPNENPYQLTESPQQKEKRAQIFQALALPTILYAILYTFFLYKNFSSITMPLFVISTLLYVFYCMKQFDVAYKKNSIVYSGIMLLLSISSFLTGNSFIISINTLGIFLILICLLLHNYFEDANWTFGKYFTSIFESIFGAISCIPDPFSDASAYRKIHPNAKHKKLIYIIIGIIIALPLLGVILILLCSADIVFADFVHNSIDFDFSFGTILGVLCMFVFALFSAYCGIRYMGKHQISEIITEKKKWDALIAITALSLISIVYLFFSAIQIVYLFWGKMQLPADYTYARYAREGFFQLLFVCILNIIVVLFIQRYFKEHGFLKILLAVISCCTYIMIASSAFRMILYIQNYQLTFLRVLVLWMLAMMAILLAGILIQIFIKHFPLFQFSFLVISICYLIISFGHVDYFIAKYNLAHMSDSSENVQDYSYLSGLSSDAAPIIAAHTGGWVDLYVNNLSNETNDSLRQFNVSKAYARHLFKDQLEHSQSTVEAPMNIPLSDDDTY